VLLHSDELLGVNLRSSGSWRRKDLLDLCSSAAFLMHPYVSAPDVARKPVMSSTNLVRLRRLRVRAPSRLSETSDDVIA
jgi:hypothetical protein